jgi:MarR family transcriptional regulator, organic hydroperoxide resistance regulator
MLGEDVRRLLDLYPRIFFACHTRHVADPETRRLVSARQASILDHLDEEEPTTLSGLAAHMGVTPSTMSLSIDRLEGMGYVHRGRDPGDARRVAITLTDRGLRLRAAQSVLDPERVRAMLHHLTDTDRTRALDGLALLAEAAQREMSSQVQYGLGDRSHPARKESS